MNFKMSDSDIEPQEPTEPISEVSEEENGINEGEL